MSKVNNSATGRPERPEQPEQRERSAPAVRSGNPSDGGRLAAARQQMIEEHLKGRGIKDQRVLDVMAHLPREAFSPVMLRDHAYEDRPWPIGYDQTISQPYIVAFMTEALELCGDERVLEIGTGSGYQTAILSRLCRHVYTVERISELSLRAARTLRRLGFHNIDFRVDNGANGWPEEAPFDAILVTCGATRLPPVYYDQLSDGGRLVIPLGPVGDQVLHRFIRRGQTWEDQDLGKASFVPLVTNSK
jgi:protein-L-isoaspartate(D-aspartate) O-methyltransferase